jgi:hypothetical protein
LTRRKTRNDKAAEKLGGFINLMRDEGSGSQARQRDLHLATAAKPEKVCAHATFHFRHCRTFTNAEAANNGFARSAQGRRDFRRHLKFFGSSLTHCSEEQAGRHDCFQAHIIDPSIFLFSEPAKTCMRV